MDKKYIFLIILGILFSHLLFFSYSVFASGTGFYRYGLNIYNSNNYDSLNLKSIDNDQTGHDLYFNDSANPIHKCSYGDGGYLGTYVIKENGDNNYKYSALVVPTSSSLKLLGVDCSLKDHVSLNGTLISVPAIIKRTDNPAHKTSIFVIVRNQVNNNLTFEEFNLDNTSHFQLVNSISLDDLFNYSFSNNIYGLACGSEDIYSVTNYYNSKCAFYSTDTHQLYAFWTNGTISFIDNLSNSYYYKGFPKYLWLVDYDGDGNREFLILGDNNSGILYSQISFNGLIEKETSISLSVSKGGIYTTTSSYYSLIYPAQIGGSDSHMEIIGYQDYRDGSTNKFYPTAFIIFDDDTSINYQSYYRDNNLDLLPIPFTMRDTATNMLLKGCIIGSVYTDGHYHVKCYNYDKSVFMEGDINLTLVPHNSNGYQDFSAFGDNDNYYLYFSNGNRIILTAGNTQYGDTFDSSLSSNAQGYLLQADINFDYRPDLIYSDSGQTIIYTQNNTPLQLMNDTGTTTTTTTTTSTTTTTTSGGGTTTTTSQNNNGGSYNSEGIVLIDVNNSNNGLLPEIYTGVSSFVQNGLIGLLPLIFIIFFIMAIWAILDKLKS